ncbi:hypothetical protein ACGH52_39015 [Streptomyces sp. BBFR25]|uniref:hypothetical protein n=1 Tax=Streptomyces sp. BBFR25 TaxID=3372855 RepID=UPI0037DDB585
MSSTVTFFRSLGGAVGVSVLGSVPTVRIGHHAGETIGQLAPRDQVTAARTFTYCAPIALAAFLVMLFIKNVPLRATRGSPQEARASVAVAGPLMPAGGVAADGRLVARRRPVHRSRGPLPRSVSRAGPSGESTPEDGPCES